LNVETHAITRILAYEPAVILRRPWTQSQLAVVRIVWVLIHPKYFYCHAELWKLHICFNFQILFNGYSKCVCDPLGTLPNSTARLKGAPRGEWKGEGKGAALW